jgi:hypothetical protein
MYTFETLEQWADDRRGSLAPLFQLGKITAGAVESVARRNYDVAGDCFDLGMSQFKVLSAARDLGQVGAEEARLAAEFGDKLKGHAEAYVRIAAEAAEAYSAWATGLVDVARQAAAPGTVVAKAGKKA